MSTIPLQKLEKLFRFGIEKKIFSSEESILLKALFYDINNMAPDAKNLHVDLKKLSEDQLKKFILIQKLKISTLKNNHQAPSKKYLLEESTENKFWAKLKTSLTMGLAFLAIAIFLSFMIAFVAPPLVASALYLTCLAYGTPIFFSIGAILGAFFKSPKEFQKQKYESNYEESLSAENSLLNAFEKALVTRTSHEKQNELKINDINKSSDGFSFRLFSELNPTSDSILSAQNSLSNRI